MTAYRDRQPVSSVNEEVEVDTSSCVISILNTKTDLLFQQCHQKSNVIFDMCLIGHLTSFIFFGHIIEFDFLTSQPANNTK